MSVTIDTQLDFGMDELETRFQSLLSGGIAGYALSVRREGLVLRGQTRTYYAKQLAQQTVMKATTLPIVSNDIEVI